MIGCSSYFESGWGVDFSDARIADGDADKLCVDPIGEVTALVKTCTDEVQVRETGLWLIKHDMEKALDVGARETELTEDLDDSGGQV